MKRKLRMGMVGGGRGAFIGGVHRIASRMDGEIEIVCGAFSSDPEISRQSGEDLYLTPDRSYGSFEEMIQKEKTLPEGERMDFVSIVTPNHLHFAPAKMAIENGFPVVIDKPVTFDLAEAKELESIINDSGLPFCLTHTYTGYPMIKQAKAMIENGELGEIRKVNVEYPQGWLSEKLEDSGHKQASWRTDPKRAGKSGCMADIGIHAENMVEYVTGLEITELCAQLNKVVAGRSLDDDGAVLLRFNNGATGTLIASQVMTGEENSIKIRVHGDKGSIEWTQWESNSLVVRKPGEPMKIMRAGTDLGYLYPAALKNCRTPSGHPEGYLEAFANLYRNFAMALRAHYANEAIDPDLDYPGIHDGIRGMAFIDAVVESSNNGQKWIRLKI